MSRYRVVVREVWTQEYILEAEDEDEAIDEACEGHENIIDGTHKFSHTMSKDH